MYATVSPPCVWSVCVCLYVRSGRHAVTISQKVKELGVFWKLPVWLETGEHCGVASEETGEVGGGQICRTLGIIRILDFIL